MTKTLSKVMYVYNSTKASESQQNKYKNKPLRNVEGFAWIKDIHVDSVPAYRTIKRTLENINWTYERKADYTRMMLKYVHSNDYTRLSSRLEQQLAQLAPVQPETVETPQKSAYTGVMRLTQAHIKIDPHMVRAANELNETRACWLYFIARTVTAYDGNTSGMVSLDSLTQFLDDIEQNYHYSSFQRWLNQGDGHYWTYDRDNRRLFLHSIERVASLLILRLPDERKLDYTGHDGIGGNCPLVWASSAGTLQAFKGAVMGAWLEQRQDDVTVANKTLATMWGVSIRSVQYWRAAGRIESTANYVENDYLEHIPDHAVSTGNGHIWRIANTYHAPHDARLHNKIGRARNVRQAINSTLQANGYDPDSICDVGQPVTRYFVDTAKANAQERAQSYHVRHGVPATPQYAQNEVKQYRYGRVGLWSFVGLEECVQWA